MMTLLKFNTFLLFLQLSNDGLVWSKPLSLLPAIYDTEYDPGELVTVGGWPVDDPNYEYGLEPTGDELDWMLTGELPMFYAPQIDPIFEYDVSVGGWPVDYHFGTKNGSDYYYYEDYYYDFELMWHFGIPTYDYYDNHTDYIDWLGGAWEPNYDYNATSWDYDFDFTWLFDIPAYDYYDNYTDYIDWLGGWDHNNDYNLTKLDYELVDWNWNDGIKPLIDYEVDYYYDDEEGLDFMLDYLIECIFDPDYPAPEKLESTTTTTTIDYTKPTDTTEEPTFSILPFFPTTESTTTEVVLKEGLKCGYEPTYCNAHGALAYAIFPTNAEGKCDKKPNLNREFCQQDDEEVAKLFMPPKEETICSYCVFDSVENPRYIAALPDKTMDCKISCLETGPQCFCYNIYNKII